VAVNLRVVTLNLWAPSCRSRPGSRWRSAQIQALAPDVVCLQEVRPIDPTGEGRAAVMTGALGMTAHDAVAVAWADRGIAGIEPSRLGQNRDTPDQRWS